MKTLAIALSIFFVTSFSLGVSPNATAKKINGCISTSGNSLKLNKNKALRNSKRGADKLVSCQKYVHADCFAYKVGKKTRKRNAGFHRGKSEGGKTDNHTFKNVKSRISLPGLKNAKRITGYDKRGCKGKKLFSARIR